MRNVCKIYHGVLPFLAHIAILAECAAHNFNFIGKIFGGHAGEQLREDFGRLLGGVVLEPVKPLQVALTNVDDLGILVL